MDILTSLFSNTGLTGAVMAALFGLILMLLKDRRAEHEQYMEMQKETNAVLRELSNLVRDIRSGNHR